LIHSPESSWDSSSRGAALQRARQELRDCHVRLELHQKISTAITSGLPFGELIATAVREIAVRLPAYRVCYATMESGHHLTVIHSVEPPGVPSLEGTVVSTTLVQEYFASYRPPQRLIISDIEEEPRLAAVRSFLRSMAVRAALLVPLAQDQEKVEMIALTTPEAHLWSAHEIVTLSEVAQRLSLARRHAETLAEQGRLEELLRHAQKMEAIGRLAGGIAHDFNNLLAVIGGYSRLLADSPLLDDAARRRVEVIRQAAEKGIALTSQLLAFSRKEAVTPEILDLNEVMTHLQGMLAQLIGEDVELIWSPADDPGMIEADAGQIAQILLNLAINARDAMPRGGMLVIQTRNLESSVLLSVRDTGCGMDAATQSRIFEPFFTTKAPGHGSGLGLATVAEIVQQLGGTIHVESAPGAGTAFRIYLPRVRECSGLGARSSVLGEEGSSNAHVRPSSPLSTEPRAPSTTILLVEDESLVRELVHDVLEQSGYHVLVAAGAAEARQLAREYPKAIDLLVTDLVMPGSSGSELADEILHHRPDMKVLLMSGHTDAIVERHGVSDRELFFLKKPFTPETLLLRVRGLLDGSEGSTIVPCRHTVADGASGLLCPQKIML